MKIEQLRPQEKEARKYFAQQIPDRPGSTPVPPAPNPAPIPVENPGDLPLPPITDPDVLVPGDPSPSQPPLRAGYLS
jgi:hypothetical protein